MKNRYLLFNASEITSTILAYVNDYDENWTQKDRRRKYYFSRMLSVVLTTGDIQFNTTTDSEGNFSIVVPGEFVICTQSILNCQYMAWSEC